MNLEFAVIDWLDAVHHSGVSGTAEDLAELGPVRVQSSGFVVCEDEQSITLAVDYFFEHKTFREPSVYPKSMILRVDRYEYDLPVDPKKSEAV